MSNEEAAWLAGLLEGEGCFDVEQPKKYGRPRIRVTLKMTDKDVVVKAANLMDTTIYDAKRAIKNSNWKDQYVTSARGQKAEDVMKVVLPYMGERRTEKIKECLATPDLSHYPRTHCRSGKHLWIEENFYTPPNGDKTCLLCKQDRGRERYL